MIGEKRFEIARWKKRYSGVWLQYREAVSTMSMHLFVKDDGSYVIDHVDEFNPDMGHPLKHFLVDQCGLRALR